MLREITVDGRVYVDKKELVKLIREHKKETKAGKKPGFIEEDEGKRLSAYMALNHLQAKVCEREAMEAAKRNVAQPDEEKRAEVPPEDAKRIFFGDGEKEYGFVRVTTPCGQVTWLHAWVCADERMPERLLKTCHEMGIPYGEPVPLLVDDFEDALAFTDPVVAEFQAKRVCKFLHNIDKVEAVTRPRRYRYPTQAAWRLLKAIFREDDHATD